jgi:hypothetical protein
MSFTSPLVQASNSGHALPGFSNCRRTPNQPALLCWASLENEYKYCLTNQPTNSTVLIPSWKVITTTMLIKTIANIHRPLKWPFNWFVGSTWRYVRVCLRSYEIKLPWHPDNVTLLCMFQRQSWRLSEHLMWNSQYQEPTSVAFRLKI